MHALDIFHNQRSDQHHNRLTTISTIQLRKCKPI